MTGVNSGSESIEEKNTQKDEKNEFSKLIVDFSRDKLKNPDTRSEYVTNLRAAGNITPEILEEAQRLA